MEPVAEALVVGFAPDEIDPTLSTREARLKWVVIVDEALPPGRAVNAAICIAASTSDLVPGLLGPAGIDADGVTHPGLPWLGCTVLGASADRLAAVRAKAHARIDTAVVDMPVQAQHTRVYAEYLEQVGAAGTDDLAYYAVGIVGPRNAVDKLVKGLHLLP